MPVRRCLAFALVGILAPASLAVAQNDLITVTARTAQQPLALPAVPLVGDNPPASARAPVAAPSGYYPGHASSWPETNPDGRAGMCGNDSRNNYRYWFNAAYFIGVTEDLGFVKREETHGVRLGTGYWFDDSRTLGTDLSFFATHDTFHEITNTLALVNSPVTFTGGDVNLRANLFSVDRYRLDGLVGYRLLHLSERFNSTSAAQTITAESNNLVNAFQIGAVGDYRFGPYLGELGVKIGVGRNRQRLTLNGIETKDSTFAVVPEVNFRIGYLLGSGTRFYLGYNFIYLNEAARPNNLGPNNFGLNALTAGLEFLF
jgi:hypothetical protein